MQRALGVGLDPVEDWLWLEGGWGLGGGELTKATRWNCKDLRAACPGGRPRSSGRLVVAGGWMGVGGGGGTNEGDSMEL